LTRIEVSQNLSIHINNGRESWPDNSRISFRAAGKAMTSSVSNRMPRAVSQSAAWSHQPHQGFIKQANRLWLHSSGVILVAKARFCQSFCSYPDPGQNRGHIYFFFCVTGRDWA